MSNIVLNAGAGGSTLGTDQVTGVDYQVVKIGFSATGVAPVQVSASNPFPIATFFSGTAASVNSGVKDAGTLRVVLATDQPALSNAQPVTQSGSWTVTANVGTTNGLALDASVTGLQVAQGSATSGQKGDLVQGAVTTAAPTYTTGQTSPLSLTTAGALRVDASATTQPVSGTVTANAGTGTMAVSAASLPLPTGAATAAKQPALGTAGAASADVITVQGAASMTKLLVTPDSVALPAHQSVNVDQLNGNTPNLGTGTTGTGTLRVVIATDQPSLTNAQPVTQSGTWTAQPGNTQNTTPWLVQDIAQTSGGLTSFTAVSAASNNLTQIKGSAGQIYFLSAQNLNASQRYLKIFFKPSASVTMGTTAADMQFMIPGNAAGAGLVLNIDKGIGASGTGLSFAITGGISLTDNTAISANEVCVSGGYK